MTRADPQLKLRLPEELKAALTWHADENKRSVNAEIVTRLLDSFHDPIFLPENLRLRIKDAATDNGRSVVQEVIDTLETSFPEQPPADALIANLHGFMERLHDHPELFSDRLLRPRLMEYLENITRRLDSERK